MRTPHPIAALGNALGLGLVIATTLALSSVPTAADEIYRWIDEDGIVNYTQQKPRDKEAEAIVTNTGAARKVSDSPPAPVPSSAATGEQLSAEQEKMLDGLRAAERARQDEIAKIKADNCQQSRDVLSRLSLKSRIRVKGENGEYTVMPEEERQQRISKAQENIALYCVS